MSGRKTRVLFVIPDLGGGGAQRVLVRILRRLDRGRFELALAAFEAGGPFQREIAADVSFFDCGRVPERSFRPRWFGRFVGAIRSFEPDVIVGFLWFANGLAVLARRAARSRAALVLSERATIQGSGEPLLGEALRRLVLLLFYRDAELLLANSRALADQLPRYTGVESRRIRYLPNPLDIQRIAELAGDAPPSGSAAEVGPLVVGMGRLERQKGFDLAIQALAAARVRFRLRLIGDGPERGALEELARSLGVAQHVEWTGFVENPYPLLREAAIFVLPSRYEGFPNALLEAMSLGLPCISASCPTGPEEILERGQSGLLVPVNDAEMLRAEIERLLVDSGLRLELGRRAAQRVREFDERLVVADYERMFEQLRPAGRASAGAVEIAP